MTEPKLYTASDVDAAVGAALEKAGNLPRFDAGLLGGNGEMSVEWWWDYIRALLEQAHAHYQSDIVDLTPADAVRALEMDRLRERIEAITQCAIEAGERSPEGVSSHTMLGDMWDSRIATLEAELAAKQGATEGNGNER